MNFKPTTISGLLTAHRTSFADNRGYVTNFFEESLLENLAVGVDFSIKHILFSKSHKGVLRGIHYNLSLEKQHKLVTCLSGAVLDIVVDLRIGSPTFGLFEIFDLTEENCKSILISSGLGHSFCTLEENTFLAYATTAAYSPTVEHTINPLDLELGLPWTSSNYNTSEKDRAGMSLNFAISKNLLPIYS